MGGFKRFLMQGELVVIAVGLVVALGFSTLVKAFTDTIITPLVNAAQGGTSSQGLGFTVNGQFVAVGVFIGAVIYFVIFMIVIYFAIVVPYRSYMKKRGVEVYGEPAPTMDCPYCLASDLPKGASKCLHCASELTTTS